jgi:hypothetical protein
MVVYLPQDLADLLEGRRRQCELGGNNPTGWRQWL